jgi:nicotinamide-nucleotide amidase
MKTAIITIGDELLIGQILDTNSQWIAALLSEANFTIHTMVTVSDNKDEMLAVIDRCFTENDLVIITGGLGPTKDDLTKMVLATYFESGWRWDHDTLQLLDSFFKERNRELKEINKKQAYLPDNCKTVINKWGTAPGMLFERNNKLLFSLPGVPYEMQRMMLHHVLPTCQQFFKPKELWVQHYLTVNVPESLLSERLAFVEDVLPNNFKLAYLPNLNLVRLRLTCTVQDKQKDKALFDNFCQQISQSIADDLVCEENKSLEQVVYEILVSKNITLSIAESCTGGFIASKMTSIPGISKVFKGSIVAYSNEIKTSMLNIPAEYIAEHGAVSAKVAITMAIHASDIFKTDYAIAVTGIAGPEGGSVEKPVGTVYIGINTPNEAFSLPCHFPGERIRVIERTHIAALNFLRRAILRLPLKPIK